MTQNRSFQFTHALCRAPARSVTDGLRLSDHGDPDPARLAKQHDDYITALKTAGVTVNILPAREAFPDSIFVEDAALVLDGVALLLNPGAASRNGEPLALQEDGASYFKDILSPKLSGAIDGGDILTFDDVILVGLSARTHRSGAEDLAQAARRFGYELRCVKTPKDILHFKTHCSLLDGATALATPALAASGCFDGFEVITTPEDEPLGANVIRVNDHVIMSAEAPKTAALLDKLGYNVLPVSTTEVAKIDGAVSCCSLRYSL